MKHIARHEVISISSFSIGMILVQFLLFILAPSFGCRWLDFMTNTCRWFVVTHFGVRTNTNNQKLMEIQWPRIGQNNCANLFLPVFQLSKPRRVLPRNNFNLRTGNFQQFITYFRVLLCYRWSYSFLNRIYFEPLGIWMDDKFVCAHWRSFVNGRICLFIHPRAKHTMD